SGSMRHERQLHDLRAGALAPHLDLERRPRLGVRSGEIRRPDRGVHGGRHRAAPHDADPRAVQEHRVAVARDRLGLAHPEPDETSGTPSSRWRLSAASPVKAAPFSSFTIQPSPASYGLTVASMSLPYSG